MTIEETTFKIYNKARRCSACKGKNCCQRCGGFFSPTYDLKGDVTISSITKMLESGIASISSCLLLDTEKREESKFYLYLRTPEIGKGAIDLLSPTTGCALWNEEKGCTLGNVRKRPYGCATLVPASPKCYAQYTDAIMLRDWLPYQSVLKKVVFEYTGKSFSKVLKEEAESLYPMIKEEVARYIGPQYMPYALISTYSFLSVLGYQF